MMRPSDPIIAPSRGNADTAITAIYAHGGMRMMDVSDYVVTVYRLCAPYNLPDASVVVTEAVNETGWFTNSWWRNGLNAGSLGVTGDATQNAASPTFARGSAAARAHVAHILLYATGEIARGGLVPGDDPRYDAYRAAYGQRAMAPTIAGLQGTYAMDPEAAAAICAKGNAVFPDLPNQLKGTPVTTTIPTEHSVSKPTIYNLATDYARFGITEEQATEIIHSRFEDRSGGSPRFLVHHIQDGITTGSLPYWASPTVDASSTVMIQRDGSILQVVPEEHGPWTNGDVNRPTAQANEILALGGNPNIWTLSIEAEGDSSNDLTDAQVRAVIWQDEEWIMRYPDVLKAEWCLLEHAYINSVDRAFCGLYLYGEKIVDHLNAWLAGASVPAKPTPPAKPEPPKSPYPKGMSAGMAKRLYGSLTVSWASEPFTFDLDRSECRYWLAHGAASIPDGGGYQQGQWPRLVSVIRRGDGKTRTFQWSDGDVYEQVVSGQ